MNMTRLDRRPEARAFSVERLLQYVQDGKIRIPEFQRPLRWRTSNVIELFDSVYRGFPVGTLLLFKDKAPERTIHFGSFRVDAPETDDGHFVVDGQQRVMALAGVMLHPDKRPCADIYAIWFDLEQEQFMRLEAAEPPPHWIPLNVVGDSIALHRWLNDWPFRNDRRDLMERAFALGKAVREYEIPAYIVEKASMEVLRLIFKRVNTSGVGMQESEVFEALFGGTEPRPIANACRRLQADTGFGEVNPDLFLRCLKVVEGLDLRRTIAERQGDATSVSPQAVERTETALRRVIGFLSGDAGIIHARLLPYRLPLIVLASFFHRHPDPGPRTRSLLVRWVWRGALAGTHTGSNDATVRALHALIDDNEPSSVERLLGTVDMPAELPTAGAEWNSRAARTRACAIAMLHLNPRDPDTGQELDHERTRILLDKKGIKNVFLFAGGPGNSVAQRFLLPGSNKLKQLADASAEVLHSHGMDAVAAEALRSGEYEAFVHRRIAILDDWFRRFFTERCAPDDSDRPPIAELVRRVDAQAAQA